jgi:guanylate kinase
MNKYKLIAIIGKSGSGKDAVYDECLRLNSDLHAVTAYSTRPKREGESEGNPYYFITPTEFRKKILDKEIVEYSVKNDWWYGTEEAQYSKDKVNIGVYDVSRLPYLRDDERFNMIIYYIDASDKERLMRQLSREENPNVEEIIRRYNNDVHDYRYTSIIPDVVLKNQNIDDIKKCACYILGQNG